MPKFPEPPADLAAIPPTTRILPAGLELEGLWYPSAMYGNEPAVAFYEQARDAGGGTPFFHLPLSARGLVRPLYRLATEIGYDFR